MRGFYWTEMTDRQAGKGTQRIKKKRDDKSMDSEGYERRLKEMKEER